MMGKVLSSYFDIEAIIKGLGVAVEKGWEITFVNRKTELPQKLTPTQLLDIRKDRKVYISLSLYYRNIPDMQCVNIMDIMVDETVFGLFKLEIGTSKESLLQGILKPLSSEQLKKRKEEIDNNSLEKRAKLIEQRGFEIYTELELSPPKQKITKQFVAKLLQLEEQPIYESLDIDVPPVSSYSKHLRKPKFKKK